jgi:hypothetical protein
VKGLDLRRESESVLEESQGRLGAKAIRWPL